MAEHLLKCDVESFCGIWDGRKTFEFRKDDRGYQAGDVLVLREWGHLAGAAGTAFSGRELRRVATYIVRGPSYGIPVGFVVMSIAPAPDLSRPAPVASAWEKLVGWRRRP